MVGRELPSTSLASLLAMKIISSNVMVDSPFIRALWQTPAEDKGVIRRNKEVIGFLFSDKCWGRTQWTVKGRMSSVRLDKGPGNKAVSDLPRECKKRYVIAETSQILVAPWPVPYLARYVYQVEDLHGGSEEKEATQELFFSLLYPAIHFRNIWNWKAI